MGSKAAAAHPRDLTITSLARKLLSYSETIRHHRERNAIGQRNKIGGFERLIAKSEGSQARLLAYFSLRSTIYQMWNSHDNPCYQQAGILSSLSK